MWKVLFKEVNRYRDLSECTSTIVQFTNFTMSYVQQKTWEELVRMSLTEILYAFLVSRKSNMNHGKIGHKIN
jgi:hypothetical protein